MQWMREQYVVVRGGGNGRLAGTIHNEGDLRLGGTSGEEETWMLDRTTEGRARELVRTRESITLT